jgi:hypothetical protein
MIADISALVGRHFVSSSLNTCRIERVGPGGLRAMWRNRDTEADRQEFESFVASVIGHEIETTICTDLRQEAALYAKWRKDA